MRIFPLFVMLAVSTAVAAADVKGDAATGATKVAVCLACHGANGAQPITPIYPSLAGQSAEYLTSALHAYRDNLRQGGMAAMMAPQVATLSDQDISDIAAYFSEQDPCVKPK